MQKKEPVVTRKAVKEKVGIFIYCSESEKQKLKRAARWTGRTLSGYVMQAALRQLRRDERLLKLPE